MSNTYYVYATFTNYMNGSSVVVKCNGFTYVGQGGVNPAVAGSVSYTHLTLPTNREV